ncbi:hypothetical protein [Clostridium folliculivorans]|uniref:Uncharacterized protein n=1 Tax=Clostridium folliculivorans TaxID=2886038 RepID=A0A9W6DAP8_9CLOT|nr:hypothetical protein [Clostridium folliculivorans]GKU25201.1 hypothetical protein CFOLD11_20270 [Clostridium folliculivorans]GKU31299.1 hypothetical protein CFB3_34060 [Clostridium folliculivorans]
MINYGALIFTFKNINNIEIGKLLPCDSYNRGDFVRYKVEGNMHLWGWTDFKEEINGKIIDYKTDRNVICWMEFESNEDFKYIDSVLEDYGLSVVEI